MEGCETCMNYETLFKKFIADLLDLIEKHMKEWAAVDKDTCNADEPFVYPPTEPKTAITMK